MLTSTLAWPRHGYRTGFVEMVKTDTLIRSDASRRLRDIDSHKPDLLLVSLPGGQRARSHQRDAKASRKLALVMNLQLQSGLLLAIYGEDEAFSSSNPLWADANDVAASPLRPATVRLVAHVMCTHALNNLLYLEANFGQRRLNS